MGRIISTSSTLAVCWWEVTNRHRTRAAVFVIPRRKRMGSSFSALLNPSTAESVGLQGGEDSFFSLFASVILITTDAAEVGAKPGLWETGLGPLAKHRSLAPPGLQTPGVNGPGWQCLLSLSVCAELFPARRSPCSSCFQEGDAFPPLLGLPCAAEELPPQPQLQDTKLDLLTKFKN